MSAARARAEKLVKEVFSVTSPTTERTPAAPPRTTSAASNLQSYSARLHLFRGEIDEAKRVAEANVRLAEEQGFGYWRSLGELEHAYAPAAGAS